MFDGDKQAVCAETATGQGILQSVTVGGQCSCDQVDNCDTFGFGAEIEDKYWRIEQRKGQTAREYQKASSLLSTLSLCLLAAVHRRQEVARRQVLSERWQA